MAGGERVKLFRSGPGPGPAQDPAADAANTIGNPIGNPKGRPGPGPDRLGLKCYSAWGSDFCRRLVRPISKGAGTWLGGNQGGQGGDRGNFMHLNHNFSLVTAKKILNSSVHTNFPIRVFSERRDR